MYKVTVPTNASSLTLNVMVGVGLEVAQFDQDFIRDIKHYSSEELAVIEMCLGIAVPMKGIPMDIYDDLLRAITYERNVVRGEDR